MTSRIHILPAALADKIAAGEVVERPASVVKELVENALDAGATHIRIAIAKGGRERIQVTDNGCGMTLGEAELSVRRHATSKIATDEDLFRIRTLGFRGEALPSIAAVSQLVLETKAKEGNVVEGSRVVVRGSEVVETSGAGCPAGTRVTVENLFYNTPARLKFLKSDAVEQGHIEDGVVRLALGNPACAFDYTVDDVLKLSAPLSRDPLQRLNDCLGKTFVSDLVPVAEENPEVQLTGWVVHPRQTSGNAGDIYFYLNGRFLRDRVLQHALAEGFGDFLMKGRYPKAVLYLKMAPRLFDVNVHPAKREVRFAESQAVHQFVARAVKKALQGEMYKSADEVSEFPCVSLRVPQGQNNSDGTYSAMGIATAPSEPRNDIFQYNFEQTSKGRFSSLKVLGALADTYLLCLSPEQKLILIDQHAAHERIGYEKLKKIEGANAVTQRLLVPRTWEGSARQTALLKNHLAELQKVGLEIEPFGGNAFVIKGVPLLLKEALLPEILTAIAEELNRVETTTTLQNTIEHVLKTRACHAQVRAKDKLSIAEMEHLLAEMDAYHATHCPHGRPTSVEIPQGQIEGWFKR